MTFNGGFRGTAGDSVFSQPTMICVGSPKVNGGFGNKMGTEIMGISWDIPWYNGKPWYHHG